jgi:hypothetical protein
MASGLKKYDIDPAAVDPNGIAENQTTVGAANLTLDGALCDLGTAGQFDVGDAYSAGIGGVQLAFDSAGDISGVTFTITGKDQDGISITEAVTGVTTTAVLTSNYYSQVTQIAADGAVGSNVFVGTVASSTGVSSKSVPVNRLSRTGAGVAVSGLTGACQYDIQETFDALDATPVGGWFDVATDQSTDFAATATPGATAVRLIIDDGGYSDGAELQFHVSYNPYR